LVDVAINGVMDWDWLIRFVNRVVNRSTWVSDGLDRSTWFTNSIPGFAGNLSIFELLGPSHGPVIVVFADRRASGDDSVSLGSGDGGGRGNIGVVADSMGARASLPVWEGGKFAGLLQEVLVRKDSSRAEGSDRY
jgi:hypothetical protein